MRGSNEHQAPVHEADRPPLVIHVVHRFDTGGLENGIVNIVNRMAPNRYRHVVLAMTSVVPEFAARIQRVGVQCLALNKPPGQSMSLFPQLARLFREMQPAVVHTRNLGALDVQIPAWWAGVPVRIHGEHGWDASDLNGSNTRYRWIRRAHRPFVHRYVALSDNLADYLRQRVRVPDARIRVICNGVDLQRFNLSASLGRVPLSGSPFNDNGLLVLGTVGRMQAVKGQEVLAQAFLRAIQRAPKLAERLRLVMIGDGPQRQIAQRILDDGGVSALAWLPGERSDVPDVMRHLDCFVLPSWAEGISNTILEAMASARPVLATKVGGNAQLVEAGVTGALVDAGDAEGLATHCMALAEDPDRFRAWGQAGRRRTEQLFSLDAMVENYQRLYDDELARRQPLRRN